MYQAIAYLLCALLMSCCAQGAPNNNKEDALAAGQQCLDVLALSYGHGRYYMEKYLRVRWNDAGFTPSCDFIQDAGGHATILPALCDEHFILSKQGTSIATIVRDPPQADCILPPGPPGAEDAATIKTQGPVVLVLVHLQVDQRSALFLDRENALGWDDSQWTTRLEQILSKKDTPGLRRWLPVIRVARAAISKAREDKVNQYLLDLKRIGHLDVRAKTRKQVADSLYAQGVSGVNLHLVRSIISDRDKFVRSVLDLMTPTEQRMLANAYEFLRLPAQ